MNIVYAPRATSDLEQIGIHSGRAFGQAVAVALETFIRATIARIAVMPESGLRVPGRPGVRVVPLVRYPFKVFYTVERDALTILHVRHAARHPWEEE
jgi:plasmid stabilization system protein ParE